MVSMFSNANLSTANYNTFLYSQANNSDINSNITIEVSSKYSDVPSRNYLTGTKNWTITDNGLDANAVPGVNNISLDNNTIAENGGIGVITATINNSHSKDISIPFAVGGTATLDTDYLIQSTLKGNASLYAGGNGIGSTNDKLSQPEGLALDSNGDLYISDYNNSRVQKVNNQTGTITTIVDSVTKPTDVHVDSNGNIFVLKENGDVMKFNNQGLSGVNVSVGSDNGAISMFVDTNEDIYTVSRNGTKVWKSTSASDTASLLFQDDNLHFPNSITVDSNGNVYVSGQNQQVLKWTKSTGVSSNLDGKDADGNPYGGNMGSGSRAISINSKGNLLIALDGTYSGTDSNGLIASGSATVTEYKFENGNANFLKKLYTQNLTTDNYYMGISSVIENNSGDLYLAIGKDANQSGTDFNDVIKDRVLKVHNSNSIVIPAGSTTGNITFTSVDDTEDENLETIIITPSAGTTNATNSLTDDITITITDDDGVNDAPVAVADLLTVDEDAVLTSKDVIANDTDADGNTLVLTAVTTAGTGTVAVNSDGLSVDYTPATNFNGTEVITYTVSDGTLTDETGTLTVTVNPINDTPIAVNDVLTVDQGAALTSKNVIANDTDIDNDTLTLTAVSTAGSGTVAINSDNVSVDYTPAANFNGTEIITYTVSDGTLSDETGTLSVTVSTINYAPVAVEDVMTVDEDTALVTKDVITNDTDANNDTLTLVAVSTAGLGTVAINADNISVDYTPAANFNGSEVITYTVSDGTLTDESGSLTVTVNPINDNPIAVADTLTVDEDAALTSVDVISNDTDIDNDTITLTAVSTAGSGTVAINSDNVSVDYIPAANFNGTEVITYTVSDGTLTDETGTLTVTVNTVNDAPVAVEDSISVEEDAALTSTNVIANDTDIDNDTLLVLSATTTGTGTVTINVDNLSVDYTPAVNFNGTETISYTVSDGTLSDENGKLTITVNPVNDAPIAVKDTLTVIEGSALKTVDVIANDTDIENDVLSLVAVSTAGTGTVSVNADNLSIDYKPENNFYGEEIITYTVSDGNLSDEKGILTVTVIPDNDAPIAVADQATVDEDSGLTSINVIANDTDIDNDKLVLLSVSTSGYGEVSINTDSLSVDYTPAIDYHGIEEIMYTVSDGIAKDENGKLTITVSPVNDPPVSFDASAATIKNTETVIPIIGKDIDYNDLTYIIESLPRYGTLNYDGVAIQSNDIPKSLTINELSFVPDTDIQGSDSFTFKVNDGTLDSNTSKVSITISGGYLGDQTKLGGDLTGEDSDRQGQSIAYNEDATIMAVGANEHDNKRGTVRVYQMDLLGNWEQMGEDVDGFEENDNQGFSVSLSGNGYTLAVGAIGHDFSRGAVRVYEYKFSKWTQIGNDLDGESFDESQGSSVSLSSDGNTLAVGAYGFDNYRGTVRIYQRVMNQWGLMGVKLDGKNITNQITLGSVNDYHGTAVSLSNDGLTLGVGASGVDDDTGSVRIYKFNSFWTQLGQNIPGTDISDFQGNSISISASGKTIAVGAYGHDKNKGTARVYRYGSSKWSQVGQDLDGEKENDYHGRSVSLSSNGLTLAVGAYGHDNNKGTVKVYNIPPENRGSGNKESITQMHSSSWVQIGNDIDGGGGSASNSNSSSRRSGGTLDGGAGDKQGYSVSLSSDGITLAVGALGFDNNRGTIRAYSLVNKIPLAYDQSLSTIEDIPLEIVLEGKDVENGSLTYTVVDNPLGGKITIKGNIATFNPNNGFIGMNSFTYNVSDGSDFSEKATISINVTSNDFDEDGVKNDKDECPNTPPGSVVDLKGCKIFSLPANNNMVEVTGASCIGSSDGSLGLSVIDNSVDYSVEITGTDFGMSYLISGYNKTASVTGLAAGTYSVCFTVTGQADYEQCFDVTIGEPKALSAFIDVDNDNRTTTIQLGGSKDYNVDINGERFKVTGDNFTSSLKTGLNNIKISTGLDCQGMIEREVFISEDIHYYPNPTQDDVRVHIGGEDSTVMVSVFSEKGSLIYQREQQVQDVSRLTEIDLALQITGTYIVTLEGPTVRKTFKIVKR
jgi:hypothetical protein